jgi:putative FmdB family regulatory protein
MPIFDFACRGCGHIFEYMILKAGDLPHCPECGSESVSRRSVSLFNCSGIQLTKQLKFESEETLKKGMDQMKKEKLSKDRIKIL